jgi:tetratricopeptide (TPR) repeat protein
VALGCGGDEEAPVRVSASRPLPSVATGTPDHATVRPIAPVEGAVPEPTPVAKPADVTVPVAVAPLGFDGHLDAGKRNYDAGEHRDALAHYEAAVVIRPKSAGAKVQLARTLLVLGELREARGYVEQALALAPDSSAGWNTLGRIELAERDLDAAITSFTRAAEEDADSSHAWNNLGYALMAQDRFADAVDALEHAVGGAGPTEYMWNNLGMAYEHEDRIREARAAYRQAAALGSAKGDANRARLEGVRSLRRAEEDVALATPIGPERGAADDATDDAVDGGTVVLP